MKYLLIICLLMPFTVIAQQWRLSQTVYKIETSSSNGLKTKDSTVYNYSKIITRGSSKNLDTVKYDYTNVYDNAGTLIGKSEQTFSSTGEILTTAVYSIVSGNSSLLQSDSFRYDNGNLIEHINSGNGSREKTEYLYNSSGQLMLQNSYDWQSGIGWQLKRTLTHFYDSNGQLIRDSTINSQNVYTYNSSGLLDEMLTYNADGSGNFDTGSRVVYFYNSQSLLESDTLQIYKGNNNWETGIYHTYQYNVSGDVLNYSEISYPGFGSPVPYIYTFSRTYTYNQQGNIVTEDVLGTYLSNIPQIHYRYYYSYEMYWPAGIREKISPEDILTIYPIPSSDVLHIRGRFQEVGVANFTITDVSGNIISHWMDNTNQEYHKQIFTNNMPAGIYVITMVQSGFQLSRRFIVSK